mmetsp:Transcript_18317/g.33395  ORF Transcript_18317/g.33395 Transcript_18317/m.33395 type:complete len:201 (-) Transcript_18317:640-1242(-)
MDGRLQQHIRNGETTETGAVLLIIRTESGVRREPAHKVVNLLAALFLGLLVMPGKEKLTDIESKLLVLFVARITGFLTGRVKAFANRILLSLEFPLLPFRDLEILTGGTDKLVKLANEGVGTITLLFYQSKTLAIQLTLSLESGLVLDLQSLEVGHLSLKLADQGSLLLKFRNLKNNRFFLPHWDILVSDTILEGFNFSI